MEGLLRPYWSILRKESNNCLAILALLYAKGILSLEEKQKIESSVTQFDICDALYSTIVRKNCNEGILKNILRDTANGHIVELIWSNSKTNEFVLDTKFWNVGHRSMNFTGRQSILEKLEKNLESRRWENSTLKFVLNGMGGVGKSWIVREFLYRNREKFAIILWFNCENVGYLFNKIEELKDAFQVETFSKPSYDLTLKTMVNWLEQSVNWPWILVFDNLESFQTIQNLHPKFGGIIIVTSRNNKGWFEFDKIQIEVFEKLECYDYMAKVLTYRSEGQFDLLINDLGNHPLAISNACYYIDDKRLSISEYLHLSKKSEQKFLEFSSIFEENSVWSSIQISLDKIKTESPLAFEFMKHISFLNNEKIIKRYLEIYAQAKRLTEIEQLEIHELILKYDLVKLEQNTCNGRQYCFYTIHQLAQKIIKCGLKDEFSILKLSTEILLEIVCSKNHDPVGMQTVKNIKHLFLNNIELSYKLEKIQNFPKLLEINKIICKFINTLEYWNYPEYYTPNIDTIMQNYFEMMDKYEKDSYELCSFMAFRLLTTGSFLMLQNSLNYFEKCFKIRSKKCGLNSGQLEKNYSFFNGYFRFVNDSRIDFYEKISKMINDINGSNDVQLSSIYSILGNSYFVSSNIQNSLDYYRKASRLIDQYKMYNSKESNQMIKFIEENISPNYISNDIERIYAYSEDFIKILTDLHGENDARFGEFYRNISYRVYGHGQNKNHTFHNKLALKYFEKLADYESKNSDGPAQITLQKLVVLRKLME